MEDLQAAAADSDRSLRMSGRQRRGPVTIHDELLGEKLEQLRRSRSGHAGVVKRKHDAFRLMFEAGSITSAKVAFAELCSAFDKFVHRHRECVALAPGSETDTHFLALSAIIDKSRADLTHLIDSGYEAPAMSGLSVNPENPHELDDVGPSELVREYEVNMSDLPQVDPVDSLSQRGSQHSGSSTSTSSALVRAAARQASLITKACYIIQQQELERDQIKLRASMDLQSKDYEHKLANLQLQGEIQAAKAEEETLSKFIPEFAGASGVSHMPPVSCVCNQHSNVHFASGNSAVPQQVNLTQPTLLDSENYFHNNDNGVQQGLILLQPTVLGSAQTQASLPVTVPNPSQAPVGVVQNTLNPNAVVWSPDQVRVQQQFLDSVNLPKSTLMTFDGNVLQFPLFMHSFDNTVGRAHVDAGVKLNRLLQYCSGKAKRVIESCALLDPAVGYQCAQDLLMQRFGNDYQISEAWVKKVTQGAQIKPNQPGALEDFVDEIRSCVDTLKALGKINEVDTRSHMVKIIHRLPLHLQSRWRKSAVPELNVFGYYPGIDKLVSFLDCVCREINDPVFGELSGSVNKVNKVPTSYVKRTTANANLQSQQAQPVTVPSVNSVPAQTQRVMICHLCKGAHKLIQCAEFKALTPAARLSKVRESKLCNGCLESRSHFVGNCKRAAVCGIAGCQDKHARLLHGAFEWRTKEQPYKVDVNDGKAETRASNTATSSCAVSTAGGSVALPIVTVKVKGKGKDKYITTNALLDTGSNQTFCSQELLSALSLTGEDATLNLETLNKDSCSRVRIVSLEVLGTTTRGSKVISLPCVHGLNHFPDLVSNTSNIDLQKWEHIRDIPHTLSLDVNIVIGQDVPQALIPFEVKHGSEGEPYAVRTALGWSVSGPVGGSDGGKVVSNFIQAAPRRDDYFCTQVEKFWRLDHGNELSRDCLEMSIDDKRGVELWTATSYMQNGHHVMQIPFKDHCPGLPDNRSLAISRLNGLGKRLARDPGLHQRYTEEVDKLIEKGFVEPVTSDTSPHGMTWYLPHHPVLNPNEPDKVRIVFDCASKFAGVSLNDRVSSDPDLTNKLLGVLQQFRLHPVAMMSDIEAMFHQVVVVPQHRDVLRFLWWPGGDLNASPVAYRMTVHLFGGVWSPSCASFALRKTAVEKFSSDAVEAVLDNMYVDDCLRSEQTTEEAIKIAHELREMLPCGGFHLTKWASNSPGVLDSVPEQDRLNSNRNLDLEKSSLPTERALGVLRDGENDCMGVRANPKVATMTRRGLLSVMSSVYDPLGMVCPYVLLAKKLFQQEVRTGKGWDDDLTPDVEQKWRKWLGELPILTKFTIPRCFFPSEFDKARAVEFHHFSDASEEAYGTVSYLRVVNGPGDFHCAFLMAKSRLAPIKHVTIPRLELMAATLAVKVDKKLREELRLDNITSTFWTEYDCSAIHY